MIRVYLGWCWHSPTGSLLHWAYWWLSDNTNCTLWCTFKRIRTLLHYLVNVGHRVTLRLLNWNKWSFRINIQLFGNLRVVYPSYWRKQTYWVSNSNLGYIKCACVRARACVSKISYFRMSNAVVCKWTKCNTRMCSVVDYLDVCVYSRLCL